MTDAPHASTQQNPPRWQPIPPLERRILGVLVEKAKTTPDGYPMSLNALRAGCNQKNNRDPLMDVELDDLEEPLAHLRSLGAIAEVLGGGRVSRYRHYMYEWLGVDKVELAVMAELLLRGAQTEGELRGRAARMEPIADLQALRPVLNSLKEKGLVIPLTSEGRGHVVTHALFEPKEMERLRRQFEGVAQPAGDFGPSAVAAERAPQAALAPNTGPSVRPASVAANPSGADSLRREIDELKSQVASLRRDLDEITASVQRLIGELTG
ncbi:MAG: DUF480 domain-containing protein [Planctomycetes bacterium]|nr:DUF480 domain-containing protein [Planctomycetota bacterium]